MARQIDRQERSPGVEHGGADGLGDRLFGGGELQLEAGDLFLCLDLLRRAGAAGQQSERARKAEGPVRFVRRFPECTHHVAAGAGRVELSVEAQLGREARYVEGPTRRLQTPTLDLDRFPQGPQIWGLFEPFGDAEIAHHAETLRRRDEAPNLLLVEEEIHPEPHRRGDEVGFEGAVEQSVERQAHLLDADGGFDQGLAVARNLRLPAINLRRVGGADVTAQFGDGEVLARQVQVAAPHPLQGFGAQQLEVSDAGLEADVEAQAVEAGLAGALKGALDVDIGRRPLVVDQLREIEARRQAALRHLAETGLGAVVVDHHRGEADSQLRPPHRPGRGDILLTGDQGRLAGP